MQLESLDADILVLEDDVLSAKLMAVLIARSGVQAVDVVPSGAEAIKLLRRAAAGQRGRLPRAIVADLTLADGDCTSVLEWVRTSSVACGIRVLAISADESAEAKHRAIDAGADAFICKREFLLAPVTHLMPVLEAPAIEQAV